MLSAASALLAACAAPMTQETPPTQPVPETPAPIATQPEAPVLTRTYRPGPATIESASVVSLPSASAGATASSGPTMAYRLRMGDGSTQDVVLAGERFAVGDRVQMTLDGRLVRP